MVRKTPSRENKTNKVPRSSLCAKNSIDLGMHASLSSFDQNRFGHFIQCMESAKWKPTEEYGILLVHILKCCILQGMGNRLFVLFTCGITHLSWWTWNTIKAADGLSFLEDLVGSWETPVSAH